MKVKNCDDHSSLSRNSNVGADTGLSKNIRYIFCDLRLKAFVKMLLNLHGRL